MDAARKVPTIADLEALPPGIKGEIIEGVLYTMTRPRARHQLVATNVSARISDPFGGGRGGPGGWWILAEPGIELSNTPEIAPDLGGWRRDRMPELPEDGPITVVPDWICEILSPNTRRHDLLVKKPYYARVGVAFLWLIDREARTLTSYRLEGSQWLELGTWGDETEARVAPFDAVPLDVGGFWT
ncbi:MAG: Uma2 family endonuclease [Myxococcales bacterium]|nr:Uma2 family endonuclease [Myxococcales bacterium]